MHKQKQLQQLKLEEARLQETYSFQNNSNSNSLAWNGPCHRKFHSWNLLSSTVKKGSRTGFFLQLKPRNVFIQPSKKHNQNEMLPDEARNSRHGAPLCPFRMMQIGHCNKTLQCEEVLLRILDNPVVSTAFSRSSLVYLTSCFEKLANSLQTLNLTNPQGTVLRVSATSGAFPP